MCAAGVLSVGVVFAPGFCLGRVNVVWRQCVLFSPETARQLMNEYPSL